MRASACVSVCTRAFLCGRKVEQKPCQFLNSSYLSFSLSESRFDVARWFKPAKIRGVSTGALAHSLAPLTHLLAPHCLLRTACFTRALCCAHSFVHSLTRSLPSSWESELLISQNDLFLPHSVHRLNGGKAKRKGGYVGFFPFLYMLLLSEVSN